MTTDRDDIIDAMVEAGMTPDEAEDTQRAAEARIAPKGRDPLEDPEGVWDAQGHPVRLP